MIPDHLTIGRLNRLFRFIFVNQKEVDDIENIYINNLSESVSIKESTNSIKDDWKKDHIIVKAIKIITKKDVFFISLNPLENISSIVSLTAPFCFIVNVKLNMISNAKKFKKSCGILSIKLKDILDLINIYLIVLSRGWLP